MLCQYTTVYDVLVFEMYKKYTGQMSIMLFNMQTLDCMYFLYFSSNIKKQENTLFYKQKENKDQAV